MEIGRRHKVPDRYDHWASPFGYALFAADALIYMPWKCYQVEQVETDHETRIGCIFRICGNPLTFDQLKVGACFRHPKRGRIVKLPGPTWWYMDEPGYPTKNLWQVIGEPPEMTATPSINCVDRYHGWVTNGVVTDDCEGRKFDDLGNLIS